MSALACIGEPISWLRLERFAAGTGDPSVSTHVAACPACRQCLDDIRTDVVALPPLVVPERRRAWWSWAVPAMALAAAAAIALVIWRGGEQTTTVREDVAYVKGVGEVVLAVVRERGGVIRDDVRSFAPGDRWKVVITCPPNGTVSIDVAVTERGTTRSDHPLAPASIACGNRIVIPGAFTLSGAANRVCARVNGPNGESGTACLTIAPE
ncbi:hypothetical protein BH11MYX3_BH11MYX3_48100 [soil metagenome]